MSIESQLKDRILVLDGAMGTAIQSHQLSANDFGGERYEGCNEYLTLIRPELIQSIHESYLQAGCDIIETNTFGATEIVLKDYQLEEKTYKLNYAAASLAKDLAKKYSSAQKPRFVAGSMGPTTKSLSLTGGMTYDELARMYQTQAQALCEGGVDYLLLETAQDTRNIKAAVQGIQQYFKTSRQKCPLAVSVTIESMGTMLAGQTIEALYYSLSHLDLLYLGLNCATGPDFMTDPIRSLSKICKFPLACVPNAGLPNENGEYSESPETLSSVLRKFIEHGWINLIGGCCGTNHHHIQSLVKLADQKIPRPLPSDPPPSILSGIDLVEISEAIRPVLVGERTNVIGSRKFKTLITQDNFEDASDLARVQVSNGAQVIDVCLSNTERDEIKDMRMFMELASKKVRAPWMIDSTRLEVIRLALTYSQGKAIINSINLEDGDGVDSKFNAIAQLAKECGAALVVGAIDDHPSQGMAITRERKLEIAIRAHRILTNNFCIPEADLYFDPLVFPCASGDVNYEHSALETIEGIRLIKQHFPKCKTVLGISNVSFGLPPQGREVLNCVFLQHCIQTGLDLAIVNTEKMPRFSSLSSEDQTLCNNLLFKIGPDPVGKFSAHFRNTVKTPAKTVFSSKSLEERLENYVISGIKEGLYNDLTEALKLYPAIEIINGPLMKGMDEVGRLFNANQLIVAEVLQSAEVMKAAVSFLESHLQHAEGKHRGKILIATVKGDVHDIGKNLVNIILSNNGFQVIDLGIKVTPEQLIQAIKIHQPDLVGLSGLLVKSAHQMLYTAEDLQKAGIQVPLILGGAALTSNFVSNQVSPHYSGTVAYASDAMKGLELAKNILHPEQNKLLQSESVKTTKKTALKPEMLEQLPPKSQPTFIPSSKRSNRVKLLDHLPRPKDFERHLLSGNHYLSEIWKLINPLMLYGRHLGIPGEKVKQLTHWMQPALIDSKESQAFCKENTSLLGIWNAVEEVKADYAGTNFLKPSAIYQFFNARSENNSIHLLTPSGDQCLGSFHFQRQTQCDAHQSDQALCLSDYVHSEQPDSIALFVVSVGQGLRSLAESLKNQGNYLKSHIVQALALETAEACAEWVHQSIRAHWGIADSPQITLLDLFQSKYQGKRYSFGYPACPRLEDQKTLFQLLKPEEIGVQLTESFMMDPEASVSAIVFHHPQAVYFSVGYTPSGGTTPSERTLNENR